MQDEKSRKRVLLSSLHSLHVESAHETDVKVAIKQLCGGWKIASMNPQVREAHSPSLPDNHFDLHHVHLPPGHPIIYFFQAIEFKMAFIVGKHSIAIQPPL